MRSEWRKKNKPPVKNRTRGSQDKPDNSKQVNDKAADDGIQPRDAAVKAYARWLRKPGRIEPLAAWSFDRYQWDHRDRALFLELLYGVIRQHGRLEWLLSKLSSRGIKCDFVGRASAAVGLYQILFLDRIPIHAVVDTAVEIASKAEGSEVGGWVNAILRRVDREIDYWLNYLPDKKDIEFHLAIKYSHPQWLVNRIIKTFDRQKTEQFLAWNNRRPKITVRVNPLRALPGNIVNILTRKRIGAVPSTVNDHFLILEHAGDIRLLPAFKDGCISVQDVSQGLVAGIVSPEPGETILDICSAPGGKTGHLAELCPESTITATDKSEERLRDTRDMVRRQGYRNITVKSYQEVLSDRTQYDAVLVDAPCSGTGVMARRPDIRWRLQPDDVPRHASNQKQILRYAAERLRKNGRIIYSTCSIIPDENDAVIDSFLSEHRNFIERPLNGLVPKSVLLHDGRLSILGPETGGDGVFAAKVLIKR